MQLSHYQDRRKHPTLAEYRPITPEEARTLQYGDTLYFTNGDGVARAIRINGKPRTWKRDPERLELPCKYGFYECATFEARDGRMVTSRAVLIRPVEE